MKIIDHFIYAGSHLDALSEAFTARTGIVPEPGGSHPTLGTHNSLVGTDSATYLELIAPDPALAAKSEMRSAFENMLRGQLYRFVMVCQGSDFPDLTRAYEEAGIVAPVHDLQRITQSGETLKWKLMIPQPNELGLFAPFFIDWLDTPHPSSRLAASGCIITACEAGHPERERVGRLWSRIGVNIPLVSADVPYMRVVLKTPLGDVALTSSCER